MAMTRALDAPGERGAAQRRTFKGTAARDLPEEVTQVSAVPSPVSVTEALAMVRAGLEFVVAADAAELPGEVQARCLRDLEDFDAMSTAARARVMAAFAAAQGYLADGDYSAKSG